MPEEKLEFESLEDCTTIGKYLRALEAGFAKGTITISSEGRTIVLEPSGFLAFHLSTKKKTGETKITLKISWKDQEAQSSVTSLNIA